MRFALITHYPELAPEDVGEERMHEGMRAMNEYVSALQGAGVLVSYSVLAPTANTTTLRQVGGEVAEAIGPYVPGAEQMGGVLVIDVPDAEAAVRWARQEPSLAWGGALEVRPLATYAVDGQWQPNT